MILDRFKDTVLKYDLFTEGDTILIAYSGGVDSTGLVNLLLELRRNCPVELFLGHFNHKIRASADGDEAFVRKVAQDKGLKLYVGSEDVPAYAKANKLNLEEAGRILRYGFLHDKAKQIGNALIATGHTMTDQAETVLMRLFRGSGPKGLSGIYPCREDRIIRPLLFIEREAIETYLADKGEAYRLDESNQDPSFLRNRVRNELLPLLRKSYSPDIVPHISRMASLVREEDALLEELTRDMAKGICSQKEGHLALDAAPLSCLPLAFQRRLVRNFLVHIKKNLKDVSYDDVEAILGLAEGKEFHLSADLVVKKERGLLIKKVGRAIRTIYELWWDGRDDIEIPELQMSFKGEKRSRPPEFPSSFDDRRGGCLDGNKVQFPLKIRSRREGDWYHPCGAPGRKKLKEIMRSKGIHSEDRDRHPVFLSGDDIVWVWGLPVSEQYKVTERSQEIFVISLVA